MNASELLRHAAGIFPWQGYAALAVGLVFFGCCLIPYRIWTHALLFICLGGGFFSWLAYHSYLADQAPLTLAQMRTVAHALRSRGPRHLSRIAARAARCV